jgi:hypothetical protein
MQKKKTTKKKPRQFTFDFDASLVFMGGDEYGVIEQKTSTEILVFVTYPKAKAYNQYERFVIVAHEDKSRD